MPRALGAAAIVAAALLTVSATPRAVAAQNDPDVAVDALPKPVLSTTVEVQNDSWSDLRIYVVSVDSGARYRLGTVSATRSGTFRLPDAFLTAGDRLILVADPIGGPEFVASERFTIYPGELIRWDLRNDPRMAHLRVFRTG